MSSIFDVFTGSARYTSMRMHGTSAQIQLSHPPDLPSKVMSVERVPEGARITSNYDANFSVFISIPTPLIVERTNLSSVLITSRAGVAPVFEEAVLKVVRVEFFVNANKVDFGWFQVMDGAHQLANVQISSLPLIDANKDAYIEEDLITSDIPPLEMNKRVRSCLGLSFSARIRGGEEGAWLNVIGAKAIFTTTGY